MGPVTLTSDWPPASGPLTVADLEQTPDDGRKYELVDGTLVAQPKYAWWFADQIGRASCRERVFSSV